MEATTSFTFVFPKPRYFRQELRTLIQPILDLLSRSLSGTEERVNETLKTLIDLVGIFLFLCCFMCYFLFLYLYCFVCSFLLFLDYFVCYLLFLFLYCFGCLFLVIFFYSVFSFSCFCICSSLSGTETLKTLIDLIGIFSCFFTVLCYFFLFLYCFVCYFLFLSLISASLSFFPSSFSSPLFTFLLFHFLFLSSILSFHSLFLSFFPFFIYSFSFESKRLMQDS